MYITHRIPILMAKYHIQMNLNYLSAETRIYLVTFSFISIFIRTSDQIHRLECIGLDRGCILYVCV